RSEGRRGRAGGDGPAPALSRCKAGVGAVKTIADWTPALRIRNPKSAIRNCLLLALFACGSPDGPRVTVTIPPGATLETAVDSLTASRVIDHPDLFRWYARLRGLAGSLKSGVYLLRQDEAWSDVVGALERGRGVEQRFTVREGLRLGEIADLAQRGLRIPRDSFLDAAQDSALLAQLGLPDQAASVEGYLFPTTYLLPLHIGARERSEERRVGKECRCEWARYH